MADEDGPPGFLEPFGELLGAVAERAHDPRRRDFLQKVRIRFPGPVRKTLQRAGNIVDAAARGPQMDGFDKHVVGCPLRRDLVEPPAEFAGIVFQDEPVPFDLRCPVRQSDELDLRFEGHPPFAELPKGHEGNAVAGRRTPIGNELAENGPRQLGYRRVRHVGERAAGLLPQNMASHRPYADLEGLVVAPDLRVFGYFPRHIRLREVHILDHFGIAELMAVIEPQQPPLGEKQLVGLHAYIVGNGNLLKPVAGNAVDQRVTGLHISRQTRRVPNDLRNQGHRLGADGGRPRW